MFSELTASLKEFADSKDRLIGTFLATLSDQITVSEQTHTELACIVADLSVTVSNLEVQVQDLGYRLQDLENQIVAVKEEKQDRPWRELR